MSVADKLRFGPSYSWRPTLDGDSFLITVVPPAWAGVGEGTTVELTRGQFERFLEWRRGEHLMQIALDDLSPEKREILQSGIAPEKWNELFPPEERDD